MELEPFESFIIKTSTMQVLMQLAMYMYLARKARHWAQFTSYYLPSQRASTFVQIHIIQFDKNFSIVKVNRFQKLAYVSIAQFINDR